MILLAALLALAVQDAPDVSADPACRPAETIDATVAQIGRDPGRFVERCVRISGLLYQGILHDNRDSLYLARLNSVDGAGLRSSPVHHLWIAGSRRQGLRNEMPVPATVIGRIDTCAQRARRHVVQMLAEPGAIVVASSHCYAAHGQMILASDINLGRTGSERMTGEASRARFGNLSPMPALWPMRARMEAVVQRLLAALRSGDRREAGLIHGIGPASRDAAGAADRTLSAYLFDDPASPWAPFRSAAPSQIAYFVPRLDDSRAAPEDVAAVACFCRVGDCSDRWPISSLDVRHQPGRPYACTRLFPRDWVASGVEIETDRERSGPAEPVRTAVP